MYYHCGWVKGQNSYMYNIVYMLRLTTQSSSPGSSNKVGGVTSLLQSCDRSHDLSFIHHPAIPAIAIVDDISPAEVALECTYQWGVCRL